MTPTKPVTFMLGDREVSEFAPLRQRNMETAMIVTTITLRVETPKPLPPEFANRCAARLSSMHAIEGWSIEAVDETVNQELLLALCDMLGGWKYIRSFHGDLYGVGWDRVQLKAEKAIARAESQVEGWLPIETAPKDGTPIDIWRHACNERATNVRRVELSADNVFYEGVNGGPSCVRDASHWMPIPNEPTKE